MLIIKLGPQYEKIYVKISFAWQESSKLTSGVLHDIQPNF